MNFSSLEIAFNPGIFCILYLLLFFVYKFCKFFCKKLKTFLKFEKKKTTKKPNWHPSKSNKKKKEQKWAILAPSARGSFFKLKAKLATLKEKNKQKANLSPY